MTSTTAADDSATFQSPLVVGQEDLAITSRNENGCLPSTSSDVSNRSSLLQPHQQQQQQPQQHLWARHDVSGFPRTGNPRSALMHMIAGRSMVAGGLRRYCVSPDPTRLQPTSPEHVSAVESFAGIRSRSAVSSASELEVADAEPFQGVRSTSSLLKPQASVSGLGQHRRRRLVLKTINRSWPSSSVTESSADTSHVTTTRTTHASSSGGPIVTSSTSGSGSLTSKSTSPLRRLDSGLSPRSPSPRDGASVSCGGTGPARPSPVGPGGYGGGSVGGLRRESFLYRSDSDYEFSPMSLSRHSSLNANDTFADDVIVTPFAQILHCLRRIWTNYIILNNIAPSRSRRASSKERDYAGTMLHLSRSLSEEQRQQMAVETLEDLEWCLEQLETTQVDRSVSDLATSKFKRMLSRELSLFAESSKAGNEISEYISHTFLDKPQDLELDLPTVCVQHFDSENCCVDVTHSTDDNDNDNVPKSFASQGCSTNTTFTSSALATAAIENGELPAGPLPKRSGDRSSPIHAPSVVRLTGVSPSPSKCRLQQTQNGFDIGLTTVSMSASPAAGSTTSTPSVGALPSYGVQPTNEEEFKAVMTGLDVWGIDVFRIDEVTNGRSLTAVAFTILQERGLTSALRIAPRTLLNYLVQVESHYNVDVPYHNSIHAADVTQTAHVMLRVPSLESVFTDLELLAVIFACSVHDVDHPGVNNHFLIQTGSELALIYNDESVLENHHLAVAFKLLQFDDCDILSEFPKKQRQLFRRIVIDMVLATDMSKHMDHLAHLKTMVETRRISGSYEINMENYNERIQVMQNLIHCADLSNPAKPLRLYQQWIDRISREFHLQGDQERELGVEISPMCDRNAAASIDKSQIGFIDYIVQPLWETWSELVYPDCQDVLDSLERNRTWCLENASNGDVTDRQQQYQRPASASMCESNHVTTKATLNIGDGPRVVDLAVAP